jgi:hypothetical protein
MTFSTEKLFLKLPMLKLEIFDFFKKYFNKNFKVKHRQFQKQFVICEQLLTKQFYTEYNIFQA